MDMSGQVPLGSRKSRKKRRKKKRPAVVHKHLTIHDSDGFADDGTGAQDRWDALHEIDESGPVVVSQDVLGSSRVSVLSEAQHSESTVSINQRESRERRNTCNLKSNDDLSPPRRPRGENTNLNDDLSPPRRPRGENTNLNDDLSPPRRPRGENTNLNDDLSPPRRSDTVDMSKKGLVSVETFKAQLKERALQENDALMRADPTLGKNADTVFRDKTGKRVEKSVTDLFENEIANRGKLTIEEETRQRRDWNTGKSQKNEFQQKQRRLENAKNMSLTVSSDNVSVEAHLKSIQRPDDPMAKYIAQKEKKLSLHSSTPQKKKYCGPPPPPHRYGKSLQPGYRWDGVCRGNGFEKKILAKQMNKRKRKY